MIGIMVTVRSPVALTVALVAALALAAGAAAGTGPVLVVVAHPDDEALGMAGVIKSARDAGRPVYVAVATNGDAPTTGAQIGFCGAGDGNPSATAHRGLIRNTETMNAMGILGLGWSTNEQSSNIFFLGYPDGRMTTVAAATSPYTGDATGLHHTYAEDVDGTALTCNGDLRYLLSGQHSPFTRAALQADFDSLLALTQPSDIYTHTTFDGHSDHAEVARQTRAAAVRADLDVLIHGTLIHPQGTGGCQPLAAALWPNPALQNNDVHARFTPTIDVTAPPTPACSANPTGSSWGPSGAPNELVEVPAAMQTPTEGANLKWQVLLNYPSELNCDQAADQTYHVACGYFRAFVKKHEFFWTEQLGTPAPPSPPPPPSGGGPATTDLAVTATTNPDPLTPGGTVTYRLFVRPKLDRGATGVRLTGTLPAGAVAVSTQTTRGPGCSGTTTITCNLDFLLPTTPAQVTIVARFATAGDFVTTFAVQTNEPDLDPADNQVSIRTLVRARGGSSAGPANSHAGRPRISLRGAFTPPLQALRAGKFARLSPQIFVDEAASLVVAVFDAKTGKQLGILQGSRVGTTVLAAKKLAIKHRLTGPKLVRLKLRLPFAGLVDGRLYRIQIRATDLDGQKATSSIRFRA